MSESLMKQALLDTNILSYFLRGNSAIVEQLRLYRQHYNYLSFSIFTYYEIKSDLLYKNASRQKQQFERLAKVSEIIQIFLGIPIQKFMKKLP